MLIPSANWTWFIDKESRALMVELDAGLLFQTAYHESDLKVVPQNLLFDVIHCQYFMESVEALEYSEVPFDNTVKLQIGLNATAALSFHKPTVNKSWLYQKKQQCLSVQEKTLCWLDVADESKLMLSLQREGDSVTCINLSDTFYTDDGKAHTQFAVIRVLADRLIDFNDLDA